LAIYNAATRNHCVGDIKRALTKDFRTYAAEVMVEGVGLSVGPDEVVFAGLLTARSLILKR
jgi:hypothetical protein